MSSKEFHKQETSPGIYPSDVASKNLAQTPTEIGPYKIESLLEKGGMSLLYLGTHPDTKEPVTVKVLSPRFHSHPEIVKRFLEEARIIQMADHPNIVKLYGQGEWKEGLYIAMEFVQGISLRQYILQNLISHTRALEIILDIAYALCHLHAHGVIHRDLKPENILVTEAGQIKVIDFGIAQLMVAPDAPNAVAKGQFIGTPIYMSPEQHLNPSAASFPADIYSLGIIAYELFLGKLSHGQIYLSLMPKSMQKILQKALQSDPKDRYPDVVAFIADISELLNRMLLEKDHREHDPVSEMADGIKKAQEISFMQQFPTWKGIEVGTAGSHGIGLSGIFYDFFETNEGDYACLVAESTAPGLEGAIYASNLRGMVRALRGTMEFPGECVAKLNKMLEADPMHQTFSLHALVLSPKKHQLNYIRCGSGGAWKLSKESEAVIQLKSDNPLLGTSTDQPYQQIIEPWKEGDTVLLNTLPTEHLTNIEEFEAQLIENRNRPPQKIAEALLRKARLSAMKSRQALYLIAFQCKNL